MAVADHASRVAVQERRARREGECGVVPHEASPGDRVLDRHLEVDLGSIEPVAPLDNAVDARAKSDKLRSERAVLGRRTYLFSESLDLRADVGSEQTYSTRQAHASAARNVATRSVSGLPISALE